MKVKYHGMFVIVAGLAAVSAVAAYAVSGLWRSDQQVKHPRLSAALDIKVPNPDQVRQMEALYNHMDRLAAPNPRRVAAKPLTLFGYRDPAMVAGRQDGSTADDLDVGRLRLSLTVKAGIRNFCVINGQFMAEGARMADGTAVVKIERHRVLVAVNQERKWVYLEEARDPASYSNDAQKEMVKQGKGQS